MNHPSSPSFLQIAAALLAALMLLGNVPIAAPTQAPQIVPSFAIPGSVLAELAELHTGIEQATRAGGMTGDAAERVMAILEGHYARERRDAFSLLRLLPALAAGRVEPWMSELLPVADRLSAELRDLHEDHVALALVLGQLADAAWAEDQPQYAFLAQRLRRQNQLEEDVLYPAALVAADYVRKHGTTD